MVFFTCSHCGDSVKKPSVSKHYQTKCRKKEPLLTCIDCLKDFKGTEYEAHTKCMTEDEKYSAKGFVPKPSQNRGERKQQAWQECIQFVLKKPTLKPDERDLIRAISKYENVPRKKAKFINFLSNAFKQYANKNDLIDRVWTEMQTVFNEMSGNANEVQNHQEQKQPQQEQQKQQKQQKPQKPQKQETQNSKKVAPKLEESAMKKEKKRKRQAEDEKPAETNDSGKADDKLKKKKQKPNQENTAEGNTNKLITDGKKLNQERNTRKRKADNDRQTEQNDSVADEAEPGKKKKKKKNDKPTENQTNETPAQNPNAETKAKKRNKKPKVENPAAKSGEAPAAGGGDGTAAKKEKKVKKTDNKENCGVKPAAQNAKAATQGGAEKQPPKKKKAPKGEAGGDCDKQDGSFDWKVTILQVLNQDAKNSRLQLQKLQKKVIKLHCQVLNCENSEKKEKRFMKKLKEMPEVEIDKDFVVLKS